MTEPQLPDKIISFLGLLPSTLFIFGSTALILHELFRVILKNNIFFIIAVILIAISFIFWFLSLIWGYCRVLWYKCKYPLSKLNTDFFLINLKGTVCLLDKNKHEMRWIKNWQTALDLGFVGEWTDVDVNIHQSLSLSSETLYRTNDGQSFKLCDFSYVNGILTRGTPGK